MESTNQSSPEFQVLSPIPPQNSSILGNETCVPIPWLQNIQHNYGSIHGYLAVVVCMFNIISTTINMIVLNQPSMISPTNFLLTMLALSDGALSVLYIPFSIYFQINKRLQGASYNWSVYMLIYVNLQTLLHSASCYIVVTVASFRVLYVRCLVRCQELCSMQRAHLAVGISYLLSGILAVPCMLAHHIVNATEITPQGEMSFMVTYRDHKILQTIMYWNSALFIKLLPLTCLAILSLIIIVTIHGKNAKMRKLVSNKRASAMPMETVSPSPDGGIDRSAHDEKQLNQFYFVPVTSRQSNINSPTNGAPLIRRSRAPSERVKSGSRMTRLLLTIVFLFVVAHLPQSILLFLSGILGPCFTERVYQPLGDLTDLLTLMNSVINFILYCSMSQQFRTTFLRLFCIWDQRRAQRNSFLPTDRSFGRTSIA